jgi:prepilin-type N-terminal cleavage/methylation domain-containing protein
MRQQSGFSMIELIVAMVILTFGMLAMGASMGFMNTQVRVANMKTERAAAVGEIAEQLRATPYDSVVAVAYTSAVTINQYKVWRDITPVNNSLKTVMVYSEGPGYYHGWQGAIRDTFTISLLRP